jgi:hypothetical protein
MAAEYVVHNNDFSRYDEDPRMILVKVDRNNTHYYTDTRCPKCGGTGYIPGYEHVEGGVCFMCGGSGRGSHSVIVRTYEYNQKLINARLEKARKTAGERNAKWLKSWGFSEQGEAWIVMGKTYEIKDQLKAAGAKWDDTFGWHFDHSVEGFSTIKISIDDIMYVNSDDEAETLAHYQMDGSLTWNLFEIEQYLKERKAQWEKDNAPKTEWYGSIKDKVSLYVTLKSIRGFDGVYGWTSIITFEDAQGHQFLWKTGSYIEAQEGDKVTLKGTIKAHSEYKGIKQTELTRCKVS